jgi:plastocyanin
MRLANAYLATLLSLSVAALAAAGTESAAVTGKVTLKGNPPKAKALDLSKEPACVKMHASDPLFAEGIVTGAGNTLQNVVVYISVGASDFVPPTSVPVTFDQHSCHYTTHVLAMRAGQEIKISNSDPFSHNIHPIAKINREWNRIQPPETPPFSYAYDKEEFIPVKCNIHSWMQGYFVVLKTSHFAVTHEDGGFRLPDLPPGRYTVTAWHEVYGTQSRDITIAPGETQTVNFVFTAKP